MVIRIGSKFNSFRFGWMVKQVDAAGSGTLFSKTAEEAHRLLKEMLANNYYWPSERSLAKKATSIHEVDPIVSLSAQVSALAN